MTTTPPPGTILAVDDTRSHLDMLMEILGHDYDMSVAMDGPSALALVGEIKPDLILLDVVMPGMDGYEVCRRLKAKEETQQIPVIFATSADEPDAEARGLALGAIDYITKPFNPEIVRTRVNNHMALVEARRLKEDVDQILRHDMRNEMSMIIGYPEIMLGQDNLTQAQRGMLKKVRRSAFTILNMMNLSLVLYKMERGIYTFHPAEVDLTELMRTIRDNKSDLCRKYGVELVISMQGRPLQADDRLDIKGEELLLYSMLSNLIINAVEASPSGESVRIDIDRKDHTEIVIHNQGTVPENLRDCFFQKFATYGKINGTGLGTYSALLMARAHGGTIHLRTLEDQGTTVTVLLPN